MARRSEIAKAHVRILLAMRGRHVLGRQLLYIATLPRQTREDVCLVMSALERSLTRSGGEEVTL